MIHYTAERLQCIEATIQFKVLGRNGHSLQIMKISRVDRGLLEASINGKVDHSRHVLDGMKSADLFMKDMARVTAQTLNGRGK